MSQPVHTKRPAPELQALVHTQIEERDGGVWVSGLCPYCWERVTRRVPGDRAEDAVPAHLKCTNGHELEVLDPHSAGKAEQPKHRA